MIPLGSPLSVFTLRLLLPLGLWVILHVYPTLRMHKTLSPIPHLSLHQRANKVPSKTGMGYVDWDSL